MADVKWIKMTTDIFDNRKIRQIENMPDGDTIMVIWLKLLILAGNINQDGYVYLTKDLPYNDQLLATHFNRPLATIQLALSVFEKFNMIEIVDDVIKVSNWEEYQNIEGMEKIREQNRIRKQRQRQREKLLLTDNNVTSHVTVTQSHATDKEEDIDKEKKENKKKESDTLDIHKVISTDFKDMCDPPLDGYNVQGAWEELLKKLKERQNYPKSKLGTSYHAKRNYMKLFSGAYNSELIDKTVTYAITLYIQDYRKSHDTDDYLKNLDSWFENDIEYWWKEAEEYIRNQEKRKQQEEGGENDTTQSDE